VYYDNDSDYAGEGDVVGDLDDAEDAFVCLFVCLFV